MRVTSRPGAHLGTTEQAGQLHRPGGRRSACRRTGRPTCCCWRCAALRRRRIRRARCQLCRL